MKSNLAKIEDKQTHHDIQKYWDDVAVKRTEGGISDNIWKRVEIVKRILELGPIGRNILEIGVGAGLTAAAINMLTLAKIKYIGTDVSQVFADFVKKRWQLEVIKTDVKKLPDGPFDMIWAFDTLEHVHPEDRPEGFSEINRVLSNRGLILLNVPLSESGHDMRFDFPFDEYDIANLCRACNGTVIKCEAYDIPEIERSYQFVVIRKCE